MTYRMKIKSTDSVETLYTCGSHRVEVLLEVGKHYEVVIIKPKNKKDRSNTGRIVEVLGFTDEFAGDVIVRYKDNNRIGRLIVGCLLPYKESKIE